jgi:hypothetical protein
MIHRYRIPGPLGSNPVGGARLPGPLGIGPGIFAAPKQVAKAVKKLKMPAPGGDSATRNVHDVTWRLMESPALGDVKQGRIYNCALASILGALAHTASGRKHLQGLVTEHKGIVETDLAGAGELASPPDGDRIISDRYFAVSLGGSSIEVSGVLYTDDADRNWSLIYMSSPKSVLWPCLIEKAFAAKVGGYANLEARNGLTANDIWETVVGSNPGGFEVTDETRPSKVRDAAKEADRIPTIAASRNGAPDVTGFHGYTVLGIRGSNIELHDPMAMKRISLPPEKFVKNFKAVLRVNS